MSDICVVGHREIICGFGFLGFDTFEAKSKEEAKKLIQDLKEYKIIFAEPEFFDEGFESVVVPLPTGQDTTAIKRLDDFTVAAAGIKIKDERL